MTFGRISNTRILPVVFAATLIACATATAQQPSCSLKPDQLRDAPELLGVRLGMTYAEVKARVPPVKFGRADEFGVAKTTINPHFDPHVDQASFAVVRTVALDFLDGKLVTLWIGYENTFKWRTLDVFVEGLSKSLNVSTDWSPKRTGRQLTCNGFSLFASMIAGGPSIRVTDEEAQEVIATRREAAAVAAESEVLGHHQTQDYYPSDCSAKQNVPALHRVAFKNKDEAEKARYT